MNHVSLYKNNIFVTEYHESLIFNILKLIILQAS